MRLLIASSSPSRSASMRRITTSRSSSDSSTDGESRAIGLMPATEGRDAAPGRPSKGDVQVPIELPRHSRTARVPRTIRTRWPARSTPGIGPGRGSVRPLTFDRFPPVILVPGPCSTWSGDHPDWIGDLAAPDREEGVRSDRAQLPLRLRGVSRRCTRISGFCSHPPRLPAGGRESDGYFISTPASTDG
jgi:hypothetical protein